MDLTIITNQAKTVQHVLSKVNNTLAEVITPLKFVYLIANHEIISSVKRSWKIKIILGLFLLPAILNLFFPPSITEDSVGYYLGVVRTVNMFGIVQVELIGLVTQLLLIMLASEVITKEIEEETFQLFVVKPIYRSEIYFGKSIGFVLPLTVAYTSAILLDYVRFGFGFGWSVDEYLNFLVDTILPIVAIGSLSLAIIASATIFLSLIFGRSIYGALVSLVVFFGDDLFFVGSPEFRFKHLVGVVVEEFVFMSKENLYPAYDPLVILLMLVGILVLTINASLFVLYRKELS